VVPGVKALARSLLRKMGVLPAPPDRFPDISPATRSIVERCRPYTMTSDERLVAVCAAVDHVARAGIAGDFVECGVWKGGSSMAAALTFLEHGCDDVELHLYDTFEGMTEPTEADYRPGSGTRARDMYDEIARTDGAWCHSPLDEVAANMAATGYPMDRVHLIKGKVEDTIPTAAPEAISILRLDTDWYESTRHEMEHLFPRLAHGGVLIVDDYGYWAGAKKAIDEYIAAHGLTLMLHRIDAEGRIAIKC